MILEVGLIAATLAILFLAAFSVTLPSRVFYPAIDDWLGRIAPATCANFLLAWAIAPFLVGQVMLLLVLSPSLAHLLGFGADHCHAHGHHAHLCLVHTTLFTGGILEQLILVGAGMVVLGQTLRIGRRLYQGQRAVNILLALGKPSSGIAPYQIVKSRRPFAITAGLMRPRVLISSRLLDELSPSEFATVLCHEQAHQRRYDGVRLFIAEVLSTLHLPATRRFILDHLSLAVEQACDEVAATQTGARLQVAETILKMTRMVCASSPTQWALGPSITGSVPVLRIEGLLHPALPVRPRLGAGVYLFGGFILTAGLATNDWWHHSVESVFGFFLG